MAVTREWLLQQGPKFLIDRNGGQYQFTKLISSTNVGNLRGFLCCEKGNFIPIHTIFQDFYTHEFPNSGSNGGYFYNSGRYIAGCVVAMTEPIVYNNVSRIGYILCEKADTQIRTLAERQAEIANGQYTNTSDLIITILWTDYNANYNYNNYLYKGAINASLSYWFNGDGSRWQNLSGYGMCSLPGLVISPDHEGEGTGATLVKTLLFPCIYAYGDYVMLGLQTAIYGTLLGNVLTSLSFDALTVSEDVEDRVGLSDDNLAKVSILEADYNNGWRNMKFQDDFHSGYEPVIPPDYPFEEDYNGGGGGTGDYTDTTDEIPVDGVPSNSAIASGFINAYLLTQQNALDFHDYLYSGNFLQNVAKLMNDPIDYIIDFMLAPYTPDTSAATIIYVGGTNSGVSATRISSGYKIVDCGAVQLKEFWGKFYDYNPYTKIQIYLPFIGVRPLDIDETMAGNVSLSYRIDVLTGDCVASVSVDNARGTKGAIYNFNGNCHSHIPVCGKNVLAAGLNASTGFVGMAAGVATGNVGAIVGGAINTVKSGKIDVEHAGSLAGSCGLLANYTPFLIVSRPSQSLAQNYNHYHGFIANITAQLSTLEGYTQVAELVQTNIHCTDTEFDEINALLKEGVYL